MIQQQSFPFPQPLLPNPFPPQKQSKSKIQMIQLQLFPPSLHPQLVAAKSLMFGSSKIFIYTVSYVKKTKGEPFF